MSEINENIELIDELPDDIISAIDRNKTSLGNNSIINDILDDDFIEGLATSQFKLAKDALSTIDSLDWVGEDDNLYDVINKLFNECHKLEEPVKDQLEKLCVNIAIELFNIPDDTVEITANLVDRVNINGHIVSIEKLKGKFKAVNVNDGKILKIECDKRRILNALCVGAGMYFSSDESLYAKEIEKIDSRLLKLYKILIPLNTYLLFEKEDVEITEDDPKLTGIVTVDLKGPENLVKIDAQGMIFPILLEETIQGMMELFASHGNPKDDEIAEEVMKRCDYVKSEPWNMRLGAELWKKISNEFKSKGGMVPYWFKELASLGATTFAKVIPEILSQTKEGNLYAKKIYRMAIKQFDEDNFDSDMSKLSLNKTIINDNIF